jgi:hypothetical protein
MHLRHNMHEGAADLNFLLHIVRILVTNTKKKLNAKWCNVMLLGYYFSLLTMVLQLTCQCRCASRRCLKYSNLPSLHSSPASYRSLSVWEDSQCCNFTSGNKHLQLHIRQQAHQITCPLLHSWLCIACIIDIQLVQPCWTCLGFITKYRETQLRFDLTICGLFPMILLFAVPSDY